MFPLKVSMTYDEFNAYCRGLPATTYVVQWGGAHVWKVGGRVFAIGGWGNEGRPAFVFKVSGLSFEMLKAAPGMRPAPYFASRGMTWVQAIGEPSLCDDDLHDYIAQAHAMVVASLSKKAQLALRLPTAPNANATLD